MKRVLSLIFSIIIYLVLVGPVIAAALIVVVFVDIAYSPSQWRDVECEQRKVFAEKVSPDGAWVARLFRNVCGGGFGTGYVDFTVEIARPDEPPPRVQAANAVFEMVDDGDDKPKPMTLRWLDEKKLEIAIPNGARAGRQQETYANLAISYRYLNDDPIERACIQRWRSLRIDEQVHRSMSPKENMTAFLAQCHTEPAGPSDHE